MILLLFLLVFLYFLNNVFPYPPEIISVFHFFNKFKIYHFFIKKLSKNKSFEMNMEEYMDLIC